MKKVLFTATVDSHIKQFHLPYLQWFKENGYEVHVATNGDEEIQFCNVKNKISFERSPFKLDNLKAIKKLKYDYQVVIYLKDFQNFQYKEICKILNKTLPQTKMLIHRARKSLKKVLKKEGFTC